MSETVYALYTCFKATRAFRELDLDDAAQEIENLVKGWDGEVTVRGVYSTVGFRADTDLLLWLVGPSPDTVQDAIVGFRRTRAGRELEDCFLAFFAARFSLIDFCAVFLTCLSPLSLACATVNLRFGRPAHYGATRHRLAPRRGLPTRRGHPCGSRSRTGPPPW